MRKSFTEAFLTAAILAGVFSIMMMTGGMIYAIISEFGHATDITRKAELTQEADSFDPERLPAPAAGNGPAYNCKDMIYQTSGSGINYVREYGSVYNAAIVDGKFGLYIIDYGHLAPVNMDVLDPDSLRKLRYALEYCDEIYIRSGAQFLTGALPGNPLA